MASSFESLNLPISLYLVWFNASDHDLKDGMVFFLVHNENYDYIRCFVLGAALSPIAISPSSVAGVPTAGTGGNGGAPAPSLGSSDSTVLSSSKDLLLFMALALVASFALV